MNIEYIDRNAIANHIVTKLTAGKEQLKAQYNHSKPKIGYFYIDELLPVEITEYIHEHFPKPEEMMLKKSLKEDKHVAAQMNKYHRIQEEAIYAFQDERVVALISEICGLKEIYPDENLYAGGLSSMRLNQFLNPHLDNSHDKDRSRWRVLNLLFYVSPDWKDENGGHLEIWPDGLKGTPITLHSRFNRLVVMSTHQKSWHSVSPIVADASRNCVSNYYFSNLPLSDADRFHVTTFRGRPEQKLRNQLLKVDSFLRMSIRKVFKKGITENPHVYKRDSKN